MKILNGKKFETVFVTIKKSFQDAKSEIGLRIMEATNFEESDEDYKITRNPIPYGYTCFLTGEKTRCYKYLIQSK